MPFWAVAAPIIAGLAQNVLQGINTRKARKYDSPAEQIKRYREAGLPMAAASNINGGGGFTTGTSNLGVDNLQQNIGAHIKRDIDIKQIDLMKEQITSAAAEAAVKTGEAKNILSPSGQFENTNQGTTIMQNIAKDKLHNEMQSTINRYMPYEKNLSLKQMGLNIDKTTQDIKNAMAQEKILINEGNIKEILANYQERMSGQELTNIIRRNTGIKNDNTLKSIAINVEYSTQLAKIQEARNKAMLSGEVLKTQQLNNLLTNLSLPSTRSYYTIRARKDAEFIRDGHQIGNDMLYLGMFSPTTSSYNLGTLISAIK